MIQIVRPDAVLQGEEAGSGPMVLLLHAGGERRQVWRPVIEELVDAGFRCVAFDQRGHGESGGTLRTLASCADDVAAMVQSGCVIVGASLGGLAAVAALADPAVRARVSGLVLVDVVPDLEPIRVRNFLAAAGVLDAHTEIVEDILAQVPRLRQITAELDLPVLLVHGDNGSAITASDIDGLLRLVPDATVARIPGASHLVARDQPVALAQAIASEWRALAFLRSVGAGQIDHPGGNLFDHLQRVHEIVLGWGGSRRLRLATLCHATYGTDGFPHALLPLDQRDRLRAAIGPEAEAFVYLYGACERQSTYVHLGETPLPFTDRFTGETISLSGNDLTDFALLTVANELDVARHAVLSSEARQGIRALIVALLAYVPEIDVLTDPSLA